MFGQKRWFLYPKHTMPPYNYPPYSTQLHWLETIYEPKLKVCVCVGGWVCVCVCVCACACVRGLFFCYCVPRG